MSLKKSIIAIVGIVLLVFIVRNVITPQESMSDKTVTSENVTLDSTSNPESEMNDESYITYKNNILSDTADKRRVLFFYASWCPTCRPADADFVKNSTRIPNDTVVIRVNYNDSDTDQEEKDLARKYGVTYQHTYVQIDSEGAAIKKWNGGMLSELLTNLQ